MITCYLVSDCGHSICGSCQKRQVDQSATRCPVCNVNLVGYIPNIALRNAAREISCTCKHCRRQFTAEAVESHKNECGEIPLQCNTCPEKFPRNQLRFHECPNEITDCTCGARVKRMEMQQHKTHHCPCLPVFCPLACGLELARYFTCLISNGNRTEWSPIQSVIIRVITKSDDHAGGVRFVYHECDYRLNWTTRSPIIN